ncbi:amidohydrolase [Luteimonas mephitis]|uniref:amidohydrolase n=1 Tax=Luteimonas mephitis TaxID=83615 RepID=UPI000422A419|nr:amidohydrolase [Luteimonas mephitis]
MRRITWFAALACLAATAQAADVHLLTAARIHTSDPAQPQVEAMAWDGSGRVLAVGDAKALLARYPDAERVDAGAATVVPGLIDAHGHLMGLGYALMQADLVGTRDRGDVVARLKAFAEKEALPEGAWLVGNGWDQNDWPEKAFPTAADLDAAFPDRPVWLERVDGHAGWANSAAMQLVEQANPEQPLAGDWQPDGGRILRADGKATGVFVDEAMGLVRAQMPEPDEAWLTEALERALVAAARDGLTGVHDMGVSSQTLALYKRFADAGKLTLRIDAYADGDGQALADLCEHGAYHHLEGRLQMRGVKLFIDGALGSRGAALLADYSDEPGNRGLLVTDPATYEGIVRKAKGCGVQVATHAIGDRGNRIVIDTYERVLGDDAKSDHRWRVEHAQIVSPEDIPRFAPLGVIASMQPTHATSDMPWAEDRLGKDRLFGAYAWQRFLHSGARLALGSDFPVESPDPRLGLYAAVTRQDRDGQPPGGWLPDQRLSAGEALRGFTSDAAYAGFDEKQVGKLAPGMRADFVVLAEDPLQAPASQLDDLQIESTWVDGKPVYEAK